MIREQVCAVILGLVLQQTDQERKRCIAEAFDRVMYQGIPSLWQVSGRIISHDVL